MDKLIEHNENLDTSLYLLHQDIAQIKQFQNGFFQSIILDDDTIPQIKFFFTFLSKSLQIQLSTIMGTTSSECIYSFPSSTNRN